MLSDEDEPLRTPKSKGWKGGAQKRYQEAIFGDKGKTSQDNNVTEVQRGQV